MDNPKSFSTIAKKPKKIHKNLNLINNMPKSQKRSIRPQQIHKNL